MNYRTMTIIGFIAVAVAMRYFGYHMGPRLVCETCHQGWRVQVEQTALPDLHKVIAQTDERLLVNGYRIRLDPDSEQFRAALMGK